MKKIVSLTILTAIIITLCCCFTACYKQIEGVYELQKIVIDMGGAKLEITAGKDIEYNDSKSKIEKTAITVTLQNDKTFEMKGELFDDSFSQTGSWQQNGTDLILKTENESIKATISGNTIALEYDKMKIILVNTTKTYWQQTFGF